MAKIAISAQRYKGTMHPAALIVVNFANYHALNFALPKKLLIFASLSAKESK